MRLACLVPIALVLATVPAFASEVKKPPKDSDRNLDLNMVGLPVVWQGKLVNYVFVAARLKLVPGQTADKFRAKEPYFRDALVRAASRTPFTDPRDLTKLDEHAIDAALLREATAIAGAPVFAAAEVVSQQPRQRSGLPSTGAGKASGRAIVP